MTDQECLDKVREKLWKSVLWQDNNGYRISYETAYATAKYDFHLTISRKLDEFSRNSSERMKASNMIFSRLEPQIRTIVEETVLKLQKKKAGTEIKQITAKSILEPMLDNANCRYHVEYQKTGVKIHVILNPKKEAQLYLSYSKVCREADKLVPYIKRLEQMYDYFGTYSGIVTLSKYELEKFK